jgi:hypothetical protein
MIPPDPVMISQLPVIRKIIQDETWLESERRGCAVTADDHVVRERVCEVILRIGQQLREAMTQRLERATVEPQVDSEPSEPDQAE